MRSQPPIRFLQSIILAFGALALLAFYVALSAPGTASKAVESPTPFPSPAARLRQAPTATPVELAHLAPDSPAGDATPVRFTVIDDGAAQAVTSSGGTIGEALARAGFVLYLADRVTPPLDARLTPGLTIVINRSQSVTIQVDGGPIRTRVSPEARTVADALAEAGVALAGQDYTVPSAGSPLPEDGVILVKRVIEQVVTLTETLPFQTIQEPRADMELDTIATVQEGQAGVLERTVLIRYEDGVEVGRTVQGEVVTQPPQDRIIGYGTTIVIRTLDTPDGPLQYWRKIFVRITAYSASRSGTPTEVPWYGRTRTGRQLTKGIVAVDPTVIPLGTQIYVLGYGFGLAADTGSQIQGKWVDLGYDDWNFEHWYGYTDVYLLAPAPSPDQINWILP